MASNDNFVTSYAQNREDVILSAFFLNQKQGFYVDVGANDPEVHSVTKYFYDKNWKGVNIEPSPRLYEELSKRRPRDINLNIGISDKNDKLHFREYEGHGLSTFSEDTMQELARQGNPLAKKYEDYEVPVEPLNKVFGELGDELPQIDFMKIDVEGYEYEVISGNDWEKYRPKVLCIEANHIHKDWTIVLRRNKYEKIFSDGLNDYYVDSLRTDIRFDYIDALIGRDIIPVFAKKKIDDLERETQRLDASNKTLRRLNQERDEELKILHAHSIERARLKSLLEDLVKKVDSIIELYLSKKIKNRKRYPAITIKVAETNPQKILTVVQKADQQVFAAHPPFFNKIKIAIFGTIRSLYRFMRRACYRSLRYLKHQIAGKR